MARNLIIMLSLLLLGSSLAAQDTLTYKMVERKSYALYKVKEWQRLIDYVKEANEAGFDYYYLWTRQGVAYFNLGKYRQASVALKKALKFDQSSSFAREYLYYSYLYSGNVSGARLLYTKLPAATQKMLDTIAPARLAYVYMEGGNKFSSNADTVQDIAYFNFNVSHHLGKRVSVLHAFSYLRSGKQNLDVDQRQYGILPRVQITPELNFSAALHVLHTKLDFDPPPLGLEDYSSTTLSGGGIANYTFSFFDAGAFGTYTDLGDSAVSQVGAFLRYYPLGNLQLTGTTTLNYHSYSSGRSEAVFKQSISFRTTDWLWLSAIYTHGNEVLQVNDATAAIVNNSLDVNNYSYSFLANFYISQKLGLNVVYQHENKIEHLFRTVYNFNTFIIGLNYRL